MYVDKFLESVKATSCALDPCLFWLLKCHKDHINVLNIYYNQLLNNLGHFPSATQTPSLQKNDVTNYCPVSSLPFLDKKKKKTVVDQLQVFLDSSLALDPFQTVSRPGYGTERLCWL